MISPLGLKRQKQGTAGRPLCHVLKDASCISQHGHCLTTDCNRLHLVNQDCLLLKTLTKASTCITCIQTCCIPPAIYAAAMLSCRCNELVQHIMAAPPDAAVVRMVDDISDAVSNTKARSVRVVATGE